MKKRYGGPWQEFRALVATTLMGWAFSAHPQAVLDMANDLRPDDESAPPTHGNEER